LSAFDDHAASANESAMRLAPIIGAVGFPAGALLDLQTYPDQVAELLVVRLACAVLILSAVPLSRIPSVKRHPRLAAAIVPALGQVAMLTIISRVGGYASPYYAGLNAVILVFCLLFTWPWTFTAWFCAATIVAWALPALAQMTAPGFQIDLFANNLFFLVLMSVLAMVTTAARYRLFSAEFEARSNLARTSHDLTGALQRLQQLDKFKSEFFANITHELKTPLTMILAPLELMIHGQMGPTSESQRASLQAMLRSGVKLLKLIGDLLDLSKLNESRLRLRIAEHDLVTYLRGLVVQVEPLTQRKSIALTFESNVEQCRIPCDIDRLERAFINLLSNAAKFTPPHGSVRVVLHDDGSSVRVEVIDNGIGFPAEKADAMFERFVQLDSGTSRRFGGTGIGLALARELVELHGGQVRARGEVGVGATFTIELPKAGPQLARVDRRERAEDRVEGQREADQGIGEWQVAATSQMRLVDIEEATEQRVVQRDPDEHARALSVLVVEDTPDVIRVINMALHGQFRVFAAPDGVKGLDLAILHLPGLIITDLMMPGMDGLELTRRLRADARTRHIPILMLTARGDVADRVAGFEVGVNAYLTKPFSARELVSTVRGLVRIQETTADLVLTRSMDSLETIAGGLAHEINNPLNYIKNALSLIQTDTETLLAGDHGQLSAKLPAIAARTTKMFGVAEIGLRRIGVTVGLMQRYAREGYGRAVQPYDVFAAVRDVADMLQAGMESPVVRVELEGSAQVECVPGEMNQVLTNVIQNALDAMPQGGNGVVVVRGHLDGDHAVLTIRDNGAGIAPEHQARLFTPFFTTKDVGKGMGLGLSIARRVVRSAGGTIDIANTRAGGCEVTLRLPLSSAVGHMLDTISRDLPLSGASRLP